METVPLANWSARRKDVWLSSSTSSSPSFHWLLAARAHGVILWAFGGAAPAPHMPARLPLRTVSANPVSARRVLVVLTVLLDAIHKVAKRFSPPAAELERWWGASVPLPSRAAIGYSRATGRAYQCETNHTGSCGAVATSST